MSHPWAIVHSYDNQRVLHMKWDTDHQTWDNKQFDVLMVEIALGRWLVYHLSSLTDWYRGKTQTPLLINQPMGIWDIYSRIRMIIYIAGSSLKMAPSPFCPWHFRQSCRAMEEMTMEDVNVRLSMWIYSTSYETCMTNTKWGFNGASPNMGVQSTSSKGNIYICIYRK